MTEAHSTREMENLLSRLDRLPITKTIVRILVLVSVIWIVESFDIGIVGTVVLLLRDEWNLSPGDVGLLGASSTVGIVIGVAIAGRLTDKLGRKKIAIFGVAWFSLFTLIGAAFPNLYWVAAMRFVAGLGEGAVFPIPYLMISEFVNRRRRATTLGWVNGVLTSAYVLPTLVGAWALSAFPVEVAWRVPFLIGGLPLLLVIALAIWLPESPRWLLRQGRVEEVRDMVESMEDEAGVEHDPELVNSRALESLNTQAREDRQASLTMLFQSPYLSRSLISWGAFTGGLVLWYAVLVYAPTLFAERGLNFGNAILFTGLMMIVAGLGTVTQGYLADGYGRKLILLGYSSLAAVGVVLLGYVSGIGGMIVAGFLTAFFGLGIFPIVKIYIAEQYPTYLRGTGTGAGEAVARFFGGVLAVYYIPFILAFGGVNTVFWAVAIALIILIVPVMLWGRETAGLSVEESGSKL